MWKIDQHYLAQEMVKDASEEGGSFGVSSLAKIGGGGGVGPGGDPLLNAAELANALMQKAQVERELHTGFLKSISDNLARQNKVSRNISNVADPIFINQGG